MGKVKKVEQLGTAWKGLEERFAVLANARPPASGPKDKYR
jgi:hypothetical protein